MDTSRPSIVSQRPGNGTSQISIGADIVLFAGKALDPGTVTNALHISQNGVIVPGTVVVSGNNQAVQFTPSGPFTAGALIQIFFDSTATDASGNALNNYQSSFTVAPDLSGVAPTSSTIVPANGATAVPTNAPIDISFSKPIDPATVNTTNFSLTLCQNSQVIPAAVSLRTPTIIRITPNSALNSGFNICYKILTAVTDTSGLSLANQASFFFTTGTTADTTQPRVSFVTPPDTSADVSTNAPVELRFNKPLNLLTVSSATIGITALVNNVVTPKLYGESGWIYRRSG